MKMTIVCGFLILACAGSTPAGQAQGTNQKKPINRASSHKKQPRLPAGTFSFGVAQNGKDVRIIFVASHSDEAQAGIQKDDRLLMVNGVAITEKNADTYSTLFPPYQGDPVALGVQHIDGAKQTVYLPMPGLEEDPKREPLKIIGFNLVCADTEPAGPTVSHVDTHSLAEQAGFQQGDVITVVNGKSAALKENLIPAVDALIRPGQSVTYTVKRKGEDQPRKIVLICRVHK